MEQSTLSTHDCYEVLGVSRDADEQTIKTAFHRLARRYHPDQSTEPDAEERFKEVAAAYAVLSDPAKRADYDASGSTAPPGTTTEDLLRGIDLRDLLDAGIDLGGIFFGGSFAGRDGSLSAASSGANIRVDVEVPLRAVASGTEAPVRFTRTHRCESCWGSGAKPGGALTSCGACRGSGQQTLAGRRGKVLFRRSVSCEQCGGTGWVARESCAACSGLGCGQVEETITVRIPPGIEEGTMLRVHARGQPSLDPGGPPGDLLITVHSIPNPDFDRRGADLWKRQAISMIDAVLGTQLTVAGLLDTVTVKVPAGTQPGTVLRVNGQGLPLFRRRGRGDLCLAIDLLVPSTLSAKERELYEQLRETPLPAKRRFWRRRSG
jgi:molecular chaperone DnaJ